MLWTISYSGDSSSLVLMNNAGEILGVMNITQFEERGTVYVC